LDLLGEAGVGPPLARSDVAVADPTGCIYIVPAGEEALKDIPLRPFDREATETLLRLRGQVRRNPRGQPYILVTKGEVWNGLPARVLLRVRRTGGIAGMDHELMAMADGTLYFLDRKNRLHVRWNTTPDAVARAVEGLRPFRDQEVGTPVPDGFAYAVTIQEGEQIRKAIFHEGALPAAADPALAPIREWLREAMERAPDPTSTPATHPEAVMAAVRFLAMQLDLPPEAIRVVAWEPLDWPDAALGCPEPGKVYAQILTPGYVVFLEARGETFRVHTDRTGERACRP
jgi:hypothetical protein